MFILLVSLRCFHKTTAQYGNKLVPPRAVRVGLPTESSLLILSSLAAACYTSLMSFAIVRGAPSPAQLHVDRLMGEAGIKAGKENIAQLYLHCMKENPDDIAIIDCDTGAEISNATLLRSIARFSRAAAGSCARRTCVVMRNSVPQLTLIYALIAADALPFMLHYKITPEEIKYYLDLQEPQLLFCDASTLDVVLAATQIATCDVTVVCCGDAAQAHPGVVSLDQFGEGLSDDWSDYSAAEVDGSQPALLLTTSGSTGPPKGVCMMHEAIVAQSHSCWDYPAPFGCGRRAMLVSSPQWMTHTMLVLTASLFRVSLLLTDGNITTENLGRCIGQYKADWIICSPLIMKAMAAAPAEALGSLRTIMVGGAMPWSDVVDTVRRKVPGIFVQRAYGITESSGIVAVTKHPGVPDQAIGPVTNLFEYKIVDDDDKTLTEPHQIGELYVRNDRLIIKSYYKNTEQKVSLCDGWLVTGDRVQQDKEGNIYFVGRKNFSLMYDHYEVIPEEVEGVIGRVKGVASSFVGLAPAGPAALVVPEPHVDTDALVRQIRETVEASLSRYKHLHGGVYVTSRLHATNTGKLNRSACQDELDASLRRHHGTGHGNKYTVY